MFPILTHFSFYKSDLPSVSDGEKMFVCVFFCTDITNHIVIPCLVVYVCASLICGLDFSTERVFDCTVFFYV